MIPAASSEPEAPKSAPSSTSSSKRKGDKYDLSDYISSDDIAKRHKKDDDVLVLDDNDAPAAPEEEAPAAQAIPSERQPSIFTGMLREYQLLGMEWMVRPYQCL